MQTAQGGRQWKGIRAPVSNFSTVGCQEFSLHGLRHLLQRLDSMNRENTVLVVMHGKDPTPKLL